MAGGSILNRVALKGTFKGLGRSSSRTGLITTAAGRRKAKRNAARKNQSNNSQQF